MKRKLLVASVLILLVGAAIMYGYVRSPHISSVNLEKRTDKGLQAFGWREGDRVTITGSGFTSHGNAIYTTDSAWGQRDGYLITADSKNNGTEITFVLPKGFNAPYGTSLRVKNKNGAGDNLDLSIFERLFGGSVTY